MRRNYAQERCPSSFSPDPLSLAPPYPPASYNPPPRGVGRADENKLASRRLALLISSVIVSSFMSCPPPRSHLGVVAIADRGG